MAQRDETSAVIPEVWSRAIQVPLYKSLVALDIADTSLGKELKVGDTIHKNYFADLSAQTYHPASGFSAQTPHFEQDDLQVQTKKTVAIYVDDTEAIQANVNIAREMAEEMAYRLKDGIDTFVFALVTAGTHVDAQDMYAGGVNTRALCASTANIIDIFSKARRKLRTLNVEEQGDWCAVVTPTVASLIETKSTSVGYNTADAAIRNGYVGEFMGFHIYISNNLPSGNATANTGFSSTVSSETGAVDWNFIGKKKAINLVLQKAPGFVIKDHSAYLGKDYVAWTLYGAKVFTKDVYRFLCVPIRNDT